MSAILFCLPIYAQEDGYSNDAVGMSSNYAETPCLEVSSSDLGNGIPATNETEQAMELRARATVTKDLPKEFALSIRQDIRVRIIDKTYTTESVTSQSPFVRRLYTTISLHYEPITYVHLRASYMLRILGDKWQNQPKDYIQHRIMVDITGQYRYRQWKFAFMEQLDIDCRMDKPDTRVAKTASLLLRHSAKVDYSLTGTPLQLKSKVELHNTLNQPTAYINEIDHTRHYGQYLTSIRAELGLRWKINDLHALTLTYRYQWDHKRSVNIISTEITQLTHIRTHTHIIQVAYDLTLPETRKGPK